MDDTKPPTEHRTSRDAGAIDRYGLVLTAATLALVPLVFSYLTPSPSDIKMLLLAVAALGGVTLWLAGGVAAGRLNWPRSKATLPLCVYLGLNMLSLAWSAHPRASLMELWRVAVMTGLFVMGVQLTGRGKKLSVVARVVGATASIVAVYGIMQRLGLDFLQPESVQLKGRAISTLGHPNFLAAYLAFAIPITASLYLSSTTRRAKIALAACVALQGSCLVFTFSRAGWIAAFASALTYVFVMGWPSRFRGALLSRSLGTWALAGALVVSTLLSLSIGSSYSPFKSKEASLSIETRKLIYAGSLRMFAAAPVVGWGTGTFSTVFPRFRPKEYPEVDPRPNVMHAHSEYLEIATETGVVGLGVFVWFVVAAGVTSLKALWREEDARRRATLGAVFAGTAGLLTHGVFCVVLRTPVPALHLWLSLGLLSAPGASETRTLEVPRKLAMPVTILVAVLGAALVYVMGVTPFMSNVIERRAHALKSRGEWQAAAGEFSNTAQADPWNLEARYEKAICLVELNRYDEALREYQQIESLSPDYVHIHYNVGMIHVFLHDWPAAANALGRADATAAVPRGFNVERALQSVASDRSDRQKEREIFRMVVESRFGEEARLTGKELPDMLDGMLAKGADYYFAGELDRAQAIYELALEIDEQNRTALNNLAGIHFQRREFDEAIPLCERMLRQDPTDAHVAVNLAKAWYMKGHLQKADELLRKVIAADPGHAEAIKLMKLLRPTGE